VAVDLRPVADGPAAADRLRAVEVEGHDVGAVASSSHWLRPEQRRPEPPRPGPTSPPPYPPTASASAYAPTVLVGTSYTFTADGQVEIRRGNATVDGVAVAVGARGRAKDEGAMGHGRPLGERDDAHDARRGVGAVK